MQYSEVLIINFELVSNMFPNHVFKYQHLTLLKNIPYWMYLTKDLGFPLKKHYLMHPSTPPYHNYSCKLDIFLYSVLQLLL